MVKMHNKSQKNLCNLPIDENAGRHIRQRPAQTFYYTTLLEVCQ